MLLENACSSCRFFDEGLGHFLFGVAGFIFFFVALVALTTASTGRCFTLFVDSSREDLVLCTGYFFFEFWRVVTMVRLGESKNRKPLFFKLFYVVRIQPNMSVLEQSADPDTICCKIRTARESSAP